MPKKKKKSFLFQKVLRCFTPAKVYRVVLFCCRKKDGVGLGVQERGGWKRAAVFSINSSRKPPTSPAALPHPQQREVGGGSLRSLFFLGGGIKLAYRLSQLPHNWPRSFLIHPGSVRDARQRVHLRLFGCWLPLWWSPRGSNLLSIHLHRNLKATPSSHPSTSPALRHTWQSHRSSRLKGGFSSHTFQEYAGNSSPQKDTAAPPTHMSSPLSSGNRLFLSLLEWEGGKGTWEGRTEQLQPTPPLCQLKGSNWLTQKTLGHCHQRVVAPPKQDLWLCFSLPVGKHRRGKIRTDVFKTEILPNTNLAVGRDQITGPTPPLLSKCKEKLQSATLLQLWTLLPRDDATPEDQQNPKSPLFPQLPPSVLFLVIFFFFLIPW